MSAFYYVRCDGDGAYLSKPAERGVFTHSLRKAAPLKSSEAAKLGYTLGGIYQLIPVVEAAQIEQLRAIIRDARRILRKKLPDALIKSGPLATLLTYSIKALESRLNELSTPRHTRNGYDPRWVELINDVLKDRGESEIRIKDLSLDFWEAHIGPAIDSIEDGTWPDMDGGGTLK